MFIFNVVIISGGLSVNNSERRARLRTTGRTYELVSQNVSRSYRDGSVRNGHSDGLLCGQTPPQLTYGTIYVRLFPRPIGQAAGSTCYIPIPRSLLRCVAYRDVPPTDLYLNLNCDQQLWISHRSVIYEPDLVLLKRKESGHEFKHICFC